jgi:hypothetical protein
LPTFDVRQFAEVGAFWEREKGQSQIQNHRRRNKKKRPR